MCTDEIKLCTCCFFGHRNINETAFLKNRLYNVVEHLITDKNVNIFLFGSKSEFDKLCHKTVTSLKEKNPYIKRIYVWAEYKYIDDIYKNYLLESYEDTYYPEHIENSGKSIYIERNCEMIDNSHFCVVYYDEYYLPEMRINNCKNSSKYQRKSGTKFAYEYATKKGLNIINLK